MLGNLAGLDDGASEYDRDGVITRSKGLANRIRLALPFDFEATYPTR
jgi:hypothetical protein